MALIERKPFTRIRFDAGSVNNLRYQAGSETRTDFEDGSKQPVTSEDLERLPEGKRHRAEWRLYTEADLRTDDQKAGLPGDHVEMDGEEYEVEQIEKREFLIPGSKYILLEIQED